MTPPGLTSGLPMDLTSGPVAVVHPMVGLPAPGDILGGGSGTATMNIEAAAEEGEKRKREGDAVDDAASAADSIPESKEDAPTE